MFEVISKLFQALCGIIDIIFTATSQISLKQQEMLKAQREKSKLTADDIKANKELIDELFPRE